MVGLTHSGTVRLVERMVEDRLVTRGPGRDARSVALVLTAKGRKAAERILAARLAAVAPALDALSARDRDLLVEAAEKMLAAVTRERLAARSRGEEVAGGWMCRLCDSDACGRDRGTCPVFNATSSTPTRDDSKGQGG